MKGLNILIIAIVIFFILWCFQRSSNEHFTKEDEHEGNQAIRELFTLLENDNIPEISDDELASMTDDIFMVITPTSNAKENLNMASNHANTRYWPYYYYSFPYNNKTSGAWPPGMYSRLYYWSPGFYTGTGWTHYMRPGMRQKYWPRNVWMRNNNSYYFVENKNVNDVANYASTSLKFI